VISQDSAPIEVISKRSSFLYSAGIELSSIELSKYTHSRIVPSPANVSAPKGSFLVHWEVRF
jgi:hypothetical protein